ncbi:MAG: nucleotidyltransferase family protein [Azospirillaceae bacterium]|nr:nucleotidyltransferase family protein [Azospirillaceae bacterium]
MKALLLAAGLGTRLRPLTETVPKCLAPVQGRPLLGYWFDLLFVAGITRARVNTHYLADAVRAFVASSPWHDRVSLVHEERLLGTGGTILAQRAFLDEGPFLVAHADNLTRFDVRAFVRRHQQRPAGVLITMMTFDSDTPQSCGIVAETGDGIVTGFFEKVSDPPGNRANAAVYIFEPAVIAALAALGKPVIDLSTEIIPHFLGRICTYHNADYHRDIGTIESLDQAQRDFPGLA